MNLKNLEEKIDIKFKDITLLQKALIHRSYLNESDNDVEESNERLEFLGDAILQFISSEYMYLKYSDFDEGSLTNLRSKIVNTESLARETTRIGATEFIMISKGEKDTAFESKSIQANTFEAILGAIYLDQGIDQCKSFLLKNLFYKIDSIVEKGELKDAKSLFQEIAQEKYNITPIYNVISDDGPDHNKVFIVGLYLNDKYISEGQGSSKRKAQQEAAKIALDLFESNKLPKIKPNPK